MGKHSTSAVCGSAVVPMGSSALFINGAGSFEFPLFGTDHDRDSRPYYIDQMTPDSNGILMVGVFVVRDDTIGDCVEITRYTVDGDYELNGVNA